MGRFLFDFGVPLYPFRYNGRQGVSSLVGGVWGVGLQRACGHRHGGGTSKARRAW